jgi:alginate O-acetyltransferase complex protein AlgI
MVFASMTFLWVFLPVVLCLYYILEAFAPSSIRTEAQNILLLLMSLLFYSFGEPRYILLLLLCVLVNYIGGLAIDSARGQMRSLALGATVLVSLGLLAYFKYVDFLISTINAAAGRECISLKHIALPIGISFYTFQALSYSIDLYRGRCTVQKSFCKLLLYISFFPQLIAGPIVRYRDIAEEIDCRSVDLAGVSEGIARFISGLGKKVILANTFAAKVDLVFAMPMEERTAAMSWFGILLYAMQIYFDFSGYSDMAIGLGRMFGFHFLENFDMPYIASSVREFWRRWHISLSTWFREYLYIPLGGNRRGVVRTYINLFIVFFVTGLWHGAGWNFIIWGMMHGVFMVLERMFLGKYLDANPYKILNHIYTLLVALLAWVFFRAETLADAINYFRSMFSVHESSRSFMELYGTRCMVLAAVGIAMCTLIPGEVQTRIRRMPWFQAVGLPVIFFVCIVFLAADSYNPFIYFRF